MPKAHDKNPINATVPNHKKYIIDAAWYRESNDQSRENKELMVYVRQCKNQQKG